MLNGLERAQIFKINQKFIVETSKYYMEAVKCFDPHFFAGDGTCIEIAIPGCKRSKNSASDNRENATVDALHCAECNAGYIINTEFTACHECDPVAYHLQNCISYKYDYN